MPCSGLHVDVVEVEQEMSFDRKFDVDESLSYDSDCKCSSRVLNTDYVTSQFLNFEFDSLVSHHLYFLP